MAALSADANSSKMSRRSAAECVTSNRRAQPGSDPVAKLGREQFLGHHPVDGLGRSGGVGRSGLVGVLGHPEADGHAAQRVGLALGDTRGDVQPRDQVAEARHQGVVEGVGEPEADPVRRRLRQRALKWHLLVEGVAKLEVVGGGLYGRLVDHPVALQGVDVADPDAPTGLEDGKEQRGAHGELVEHEVASVGAGEDGTDGIVA